MVKQLCVLAVLVFVIGCGGGGGSAASRLDGSWLFTSPNGVGVGAIFSPDDTYVAMVIVVTAAGQNSGSLEMQVEKGRFSVSGDQLTSTPTHWTCPGPDPIDTATFSFSGQDLVISSPTGFITFAPNNAPTSTATITATLGCFDANGAFTASPLAPVTN